MKSNTRLNTREVALAAVFTALYVVLSFVKISPILGLSGPAITAADVVAPIMGILLGPYVGVLSTLLGGAIGFSVGSLTYFSLVAGVATAFSAGMIQIKKRIVSIVTYVSLFFLFAFFPTVGTFWLFPWNAWFQIVGLVVLISPLQFAAAGFLNSENDTKLGIGLFFTSLTCTLAGQIAGSLLFEVLTFSPATLQPIWTALTFIYPIERIVIASIATLIGIPLVKVLRSANLFSPIRS